MRRGAAAPERCPAVARAGRVQAAAPLWATVLLLLLVLAIAKDSVTWPAVGGALAGTALGQLLVGYRRRRPPRAHASGDLGAHWFLVVVVVLPLAAAVLLMAVMPEQLTIRHGLLLSPAQKTMLRSPLRSELVAWSYNTRWRPQVRVVPGGGVLVGDGGRLCLLTPGGTPVWHTTWDGGDLAEVTSVGGLDGLVLAVPATGRTHVYLFGLPDYALQLRVEAGPGTLAVPAGAGCVLVWDPGTLSVESEHGRLWERSLAGDVVGLSWWRDLALAATGARLHAFGTGGDELFSVGWGDAPCLAGPVLGTEHAYALVGGVESVAPVAVDLRTGAVHTYGILLAGVELVEIGGYVAVVGDASSWLLDGPVLAGLDGRLVGVTRAGLGLTVRRERESLYGGGVTVLRYYDLTAGPSLVDRKVTDDVGDFGLDPDSGQLFHIRGTLLQVAPLRGRQLLDLGGPPAYTIGEPGLVVPLELLDGRGRVHYLDLKRWFAAGR